LIGGRGGVRSKTLIIAFIAVIAVVTLISIYVSATVDKVDKSFTAFVSPDGRYKAVRLSLARGGSAPLCFESISIFLSVYPDTFAETEKAYQVYAAPCATPANPANAPQVEWLSNQALRITYSPAPAGFDVSNLRRRLVDASQFVRINYATRQAGVDNSVIGK
jgi:hypothetical protein